MSVNARSSYLFGNYTDLILSLQNYEYYKHAKTVNLLVVSGVSGLKIKEHDA
jgi:hypothetical protein